MRNFLHGRGDADCRLKDSVHCRLLVLGIGWGCVRRIRCPWNKAVFVESSPSPSMDQKPLTKPSKTLSSVVDESPLVQINRPVARLNPRFVGWIHLQQKTCTSTSHSPTICQSFANHVAKHFPIWRFPTMRVPQHWGFIREIPTEVDDFGVPLFQETS